MRQHLMSAAGLLMAVATSTAALNCHPSTATQPSGSAAAVLDGSADLTQEVHDPKVAAFAQAPPVDVPTASSPEQIRSRQIFWPFTTSLDPDNLDPPRGGLVPAWLEIGPNESQSVRVSIQERGIDSIGQQLRASIWMASFLAASSLDLPLTCCTFSVAPGIIEGIYRLDGYSAGAETTAAMMAALLDRPILPSVTMTGTVNPDGSVGAVGGLRDKLLAAVHEGKKEFGVPVGQYYEFDAKTKRMEDLRELAGRHNIRLIEIKDINDAYRLLTGRMLKPSEPLTIELMEKKLDWIKGRAETWQRLSRDISTQLQKRMSREVGYSESHKQFLEQSLKNIEKMDTKIDAVILSKMYAQAYHGALDLFMNASAVQYMAEALRGGDESDVQAQVNRLVRALTMANQSWVATKQEFEVRPPTTINEAIELIDLYAFAMNGWARIKAVHDEMNKMSKKSSSDAKSSGEQARTFLLVIAQAEAIFEIVRQEQRSRGGEPAMAAHKVEFDIKALQRLAQAYTSAARANQRYYEEEVRRQATGHKGRFLDEVTDPTRTCRDVLSYAVVNESVPGIHAALANLGAAIKAYSCVAAYLAPMQAGSLGYDENFNPIISDKRVFAEMLMLADTKAREAARIALGVTKDDVPLSSRIWYAQARMMRESENPLEKIAALQSFWDSSTRSRLAVLVRRTAANPVSSPVPSKDMSH